nr:hypothetical protein [Mycoplasmopsis bovis]
MKREWLGRMFHKGFDFNSISQVQLDDVVNQINEMPRKILNWQKLNWTI